VPFDGKKTLCLLSEVTHGEDRFPESRKKVARGVPEVQISKQTPREAPHSENMPRSCPWSHFAVSVYKIK
jgi:hypothetical protein